jgi:hypothetical protein
MSNVIPVTEFAPAERMPIEVIQRQSDAIASTPATQELLNSVLNRVLILNGQRQIIFASENCADFAPDRDIRSLLGKRPGEALNCIHSHEFEGGCGTTKFCSECGAAAAILGSLAGRKETRECHITRLLNLSPEALDLLVYATPYEHNREIFTIFSIADISHEKRRRALEKVFFHDVVNYAGGLEGLAAMLETEAPPSMKEDMELMRSGLHDLMEEIQTQKTLSSAEANELAATLSSIDPQAFLTQLLHIFRHHDTAKGKFLLLNPAAVQTSFQTDATLLHRIINNLVKNALEATPDGGLITVGFDCHDKTIRFWVKNLGEIPRAGQLQIFNRSYSTKGEGRGLGTYSVKLFTEKYLKGKAGFTTDKEHGTEFFIELPLF